MLGEYWGVPITIKNWVVSIVADGLLVCWLVGLLLGGFTFVPRVLYFRFSCSCFFVLRAVFGENFLKSGQDPVKCLSNRLYWKKLIFIRKWSLLEAGDGCPLLER